MKQALEQVSKSVPAELVAVITTLPRGSLQIAQPARLPEGLIRSYGRQFHLEDRLTWHAILENRATQLSDVLPEDSSFVREYLALNGLAHAAAAPLNSPIIAGYPGALHAYRTAEQGPFSAEDLRNLAQAAKEIDEAVAAVQGREEGDHDPKVTLTPRPKARVFAFNAKGEQLIGQADFATLDSHLQRSLADQARASLGRLNGEMVNSDRVQFPDSRGDLWTFRMVVYSKYPAFGSEPVVLFCMQPSCAEWAAVRPADLQADAEMSRLIPALKFMRQEFHRGPTLGEIARIVHLSPFHFHRRFAELLGLTPKHYLLECQINAAKGELLAAKKELSQIAADCGFAHQSHFTSRFKQATGLTPTRWRRHAMDALRS